MQLVTTEEASKMLMVAERTLLHWRKNSQGPNYIKLGGSVRYRMADIESWIEQNTCKTGANAMQMQSKCKANAKQLQEA